MKSRFIRIPWFGAADYNENAGSSTLTSSAVTVAPKGMALFDMKFLEWSIHFFTKSGGQMPTTVNRSLKKYGQPHTGADSSSKYSAIRFRPYVCKVPWHTGARAILSQLFPRYGHYCGPNWSSGKDRGSLIWDRRPIDQLDYCCYCHDIGYDTHDQAGLLKADLAFLECLESSNTDLKGNPRIAHLYKTMCISGLRYVLIPYRLNLLGLQDRQLPIDFRWLSAWTSKGWNLHKDLSGVTTNFGVWLNNLKRGRHALQKL